jgi:flagellar protein FlaG
MRILSIVSANGPVFETLTSSKQTGLGNEASPAPSPNAVKSPTVAVTGPTTAEAIVGRDQWPAQKLPRLVINGEGVGIRFEMDNATGTTVIRLVDLQTGDVIRQIPPEEVLNHLRQFEPLKGRLFSRTL